MVMLTFLAFLSPTNTFAQCGKGVEVEVVHQYKPEDYLGKYKLIRAIDMKDASGTFVAVIIKRTDDPTKPVVAFNEESPGVTAAIINDAKGVRVSLNEDGKRLVVEFLNKDGAPYFRSILQPFK